MTSPLWDLLEEARGVPGPSYHGVRVMRHYGDPHQEYLAATGGAAVFDRSHRSRLVVSGRAPGRMLGGIVTGTIPEAPEVTAEGVVGGTARYSAVLTPKGRMITDLWCSLRGSEEEDGFLLDVPVAGRHGLLAHFRKFLPPRMARVEDVSDAVAMVTVVGPDAAALLSRLAVGLRLDAAGLSRLEEGEWRAIVSGVAGRYTRPHEGGGGPPPSISGALAVMRTRDVWPDAYSVAGPTESVRALWAALLVSGARAAGLGVWSTLRVEAARPAFGTDMDETTIPVEAGIHERAIDYTKGCYTGQEVIVRIRDRGHVNRSLRRIHLGDVPTPAPGAELYAEGAPHKVVGRVTSAVESPRFGGTVALAYVRREVPDDAVLRVGVR